MAQLGDLVPQLGAPRTELNKTQTLQGALTLIHTLRQRVESQEYKYGLMEEHVRQLESSLAKVHQENVDLKRRCRPHQDQQSMEHGDSTEDDQDGDSDVVGEELESAVKRKRL
jgi:hypothetical protein